MNHPRLKKSAILTVTAAVGLLSWDSSAYSQQSPEIQTLRVRGNVYMLAGAGGNITVQVGPQGLVVVDTGLASMSGAVVAAIRKLSSAPIRYIVDTNSDEDHVGGNQALTKLGRSLLGGPNSVVNPSFEEQGATIIAHEKVLTRMSAPTGSKSPYSAAAWPTDTFPNDEMDIFLNGEGIPIYYQPAAHTDGDSLVFFRRSDVISAGDVFLTTTFPVIDVKRGGSVNGEIDALNRIIDMAIPEDKQEGGTYIIPGHGRLCDEADVLEYRDMVTIIRDRVADMIERGMSLEQVKAADPTMDYRGRYGSETGPWTTNQFVEAVYNSLREKRQTR